MEQTQMAIIDGFLDQMAVNENGCWVWRGEVGRDGYGKMRNPYDRRYMKGTHRISYRLLVGDIPDRWLVLHACGNKLCVHPMHLRLVPPRSRFAEKFRWGIFGWDSRFSPG